MSTAELTEEHLDHLSSENASLASQVESMAMRIESLAEELAKPEDVRLREVLDALDGRFVIFDSVASRVSAALDEAEEFIGRAGEAERMVDAARRSLASVADHVTDHAYQELASALEAPPREHTVGDALGLPIPSDAFYHVRRATPDDLDAAGYISLAEHARIVDELLNRHEASNG